MAVTPALAEALFVCYLHRRSIFIFKPVIHHGTIFRTGFILNPHDQMNISIIVHVNQELTVGVVLCLVLPALTPFAAVDRLILNILTDILCKDRLNLLPFSVR